MTELAPSPTEQELVLVELAPSPTEQELVLVAQIYDKANYSRPGYIEKEIVEEILIAASVNLPSIILSTIWNLVDDAKSGYLSERNVALALRFIGWAQSGEEVTAELANRSGGPLPQITLGAAQEVECDWPPFTEDERDASEKLFTECGPVYGLLEGDKARDAFLTFNLAPTDIWKIWQIADTRKRGALDRYDFALAMYLIQGVQSGRLPSIPPATPPQVYEQIRAISTSPQISSPTSPQLPAKSPRPRKPTRPPPPPSPHIRSASFSAFSQKPTRPPPSPLGSDEIQSSTSPVKAQKPVRPPPSPLVLPEAAPLSWESTSPPIPQKPTRPPPSPMVLPVTPTLTRSTPTASSQFWDVSPTAKATAEREFALLDSENVGYVEGDVVAKFLRKFKLVPEDLALIWDLADLNQDNRLTHEEFVIAMNLIEMRLQGAELPYVLPTSMIPPSMRTRSPNTSLRRAASSPYHSNSSPAGTRLRNITVSGFAKPPSIPPKSASASASPTIRHSIAAYDNRAIPPRLSTSQDENRATPPTRLTPSRSNSHSLATIPDETLIEEVEIGSNPGPNPQLVALQEQYQILEKDNIRLSTKVEELSARVSSQSDLFDEAEKVSREQYQLLEEDNARLLSQLDDISSQIAAQRGIQEQNDDLSRENATLAAKILEMEQITLDVLQSNEAAGLVQQLEANNAELQRRVHDMERLQPQLEDTSRRLQNALEDNKDLSTRLREARNSADAESRQAEMEMENMRKTIRGLGQENEALQYRANELQRAISKAPATPSEAPTTGRAPWTSPANAQEMEILMGDVTRENESLKERLRQMERSTANFLLSTSGHAEQESLRRSNHLLTVQVQDLEQLIAQLQRSSEEHELQRVLKDVTVENDKLKQSLRHTELKVTQLQQTSRQVEPLQREVEELKAEIRRLHVVNAQAQPREEEAAPPPAYEDDPFH